MHNGPNAHRPPEVAGHPFGVCGETVGVGADLERMADVDAGVLDEQELARKAVEPDHP